MTVAGQILAAAPTGMAGPVALFVIVLLGLAAVVLFRSMSRHLKRVPVAFGDDPRDDPKYGGTPPAPPDDAEKS